MSFDLLTLMIYIPLDPTYPILISPPSHLLSMPVLHPSHESRPVSHTIPACFVFSHSFSLLRSHSVSMSLSAFPDIVIVSVASPTLLSSIAYRSQKTLATPTRPICLPSLLPHPPNLPRHESAAYSFPSAACYTSLPVPYHHPSG